MKAEVSVINFSEESSLSLLSQRLDALEKHTLSFSPWPTYAYRPEVAFSIAYASNYLLLKYYVTEKEIRTCCSQINSSVYEDSCVEFFLSFDGAHYYNLEFNLIGSVLGQYGKDKSDRVFLPSTVLKKIRFASCLHNTDAGFYWELLCIIPFDVFAYDTVADLRGKNISANFYKCGDALSDPHYMAWSNIKSPEPNFHLPAYFGRLVFK